jgi:hypothetical protein
VSVWVSQEAVFIYLFIFIFLLGLEVICLEKGKNSGI